MTTKIGETIQKLRKSRGISLRELAPRVGIHFSHLSHIENGRQPCGRETLIRIAEELGADVELLLAEGGHRMPPIGFWATSPPVFRLKLRSTSRHLI